MISPKVSAVIPAFNAEASISRAIQSILNQTHKAEQIIVVDDGSTDGTKEAVSAFGDRVEYIYQENSGPSQARNTGIRAAREEWIAFLDSDDEWHEDKLERQVEMLRQNPQLKWCGANCFNINGTVKTYRGSPQKARAGLKGASSFPSYLAAVGEGHIFESTITLVIHRSVFDKVGLFNPRFIRGQDMDMWCRIAIDYPEFGYIPEPLATIHLDVANPILQKRRVKEKKGTLIREIVRNNLPLARATGCYDDFLKYARIRLENSLLQTIYHGHKEDARETVDAFPEIFPGYWRPVVYALTRFPSATSQLAKTAMKLYSMTMGEYKVTRRWTDH